MSTSVSQNDLVVRQPARRSAGGPWLRLQGFLRRSRAWIHRHPRLRAPYRVLVAVVGLTVIAIGLVLVPLPGPGWLIVFVGVAVLGTEFPAAHRLTVSVRRMAHRVRQWWRAHRDRQSARSSGAEAA